MKNNRSSTFLSFFLTLSLGCGGGLVDEPVKKEQEDKGKSAIVTQPSTKEQKLKAETVKEPSYQQKAPTKKSWPGLVFPTKTEGEKSKPFPSLAEPIMPAAVLRGDVGEEAYESCVVETMDLAEQCVLAGREVATCKSKSIEALELCKQLR